MKPALGAGGGGVGTGGGIKFRTECDRWAWSCSPSGDPEGQGDLGTETLDTGRGSTAPHQLVSKVTLSTEDGVGLSEGLSLLLFFLSIVCEKIWAA